MPADGVCCLIRVREDGTDDVGTGGDATEYPVGCRDLKVRTIDMLQDKTVDLFIGIF